MKNRRALCVFNGFIEGVYDDWVPLEPKPCCNICFYLQNRICVEPIVCKQTFKPRCPEVFFCSEFRSIDEMKESLKHCPICDSTNIYHEEHYGLNTKCNACGHRWVILWAKHEWYDSHLKRTEAYMEWCGWKMNGGIEPQFLSTTINQHRPKIGFQRVSGR